MCAPKMSHTLLSLGSDGRPAFLAPEDKAARLRGDPAVLGAQRMCKESRPVIYSAPVSLSEKRGV